jgi:hypothetical protein
MLRQEIILISKLKICTKLFNKNKEKHYKMKQHTKTKELYKMENNSFISKLLVIQWPCIPRY